MQYNPGFANIYNLRWGGFANHVAPRIREFYESTLLGKMNKSMLDVCCGTGQLALHFLENGYDVTGLDFSPLLTRSITCSMWRLYGVVSVLFSRSWCRMGALFSISIRVTGCSAGLMRACK